MVSVNLVDEVKLFVEPGDQLYIDADMLDLLQSLRLSGQGAANNQFLTALQRKEQKNRRAKKDWAQVMKDLVERDYPEADRLTLVRDNLSSHLKGALYDLFAPEEAKRIADKSDIHFTPKRGVGSIGPRASA